VLAKYRRRMTWREIGDALAIIHNAKIQSLAWVGSSATRPRLVY
jgi:hypothetical protein